MAGVLGDRALQGGTCCMNYESTGVGAVKSAPVPHKTQGVCDDASSPQTISRTETVAYAHNPARSRKRPEPTPRIATGEGEVVLNHPPLQPQDCCIDYTDPELPPVRPGVLTKIPRGYRCERNVYGYLRAVEFRVTRKKVDGTWVTAYRAFDRTIHASVATIATATGLPTPCVADSGLLTRETTLFAALSGRCRYCNAQIGPNLLAIAGLYREDDMARAVLQRILDWTKQQQPDIYAALTTPKQTNDFSTESRHDNGTK